MSQFEVVKTKIAEINAHPNADRLQLSKVENCDYQFIVGKDEYKVGDDVIYFPIDSLLPPIIVEKLGLTGKLAGKDKNRVKSIKLRDAVSQGIVCKASAFDIADCKTNEEITKKLGVTKYEPEPIMCQAGELLPLPDGVGVYDIENAENYKDVIELLMDQPVQISEKIEGSNISIHLDKDGNEFICRRNYSIKQLEGSQHTFWKTAISEGLLQKAHLIQEDFNLPITIRGEIIGPGIQGNYYQLKQNEIRVFDIMINYKYVDTTVFLVLCQDYGINTVPVINGGTCTLKGFLGGKTVVEESNGISTLVNKPREGIVIKPVVEQRHEKIGRLIIKARSPEYLAKEK